jgi:hypothetical protein
MGNCRFLPVTYLTSRRRGLCFTVIRFPQKAFYRKEIFECEKQS